MKIRTDFVTNSSSSNYVFCRMDNPEFFRAMEEIGIRRVQNSWRDVFVLPSGLKNDREVDGSESFHGLGISDASITAMFVDSIVKNDKTAFRLEFLRILKSAGYIESDELDKEWDPDKIWYMIQDGKLDVTPTEKLNAFDATLQSAEYEEREWFEGEVSAYSTIVKGHIKYSRECFGIDENYSLFDAGVEEIMHEFEPYHSVYEEYIDGKWVEVDEKEEWGF